MKAETAAEQLFFTTAFLTARNAEITMLGTGFLYRIDSNQGAHLLLATNKHLMEGFTSLTVRFIRQDAEKNPLLGTASEFTITDLQISGWIGHPNENVDVAVLNISPYLNAMAAAGEPAFYKSVNENISLGVGLELELNALEEVTFIGYPAGIFDSHNFLPIARRGMTATPIEVDYRNQPAFVVDASVYQGSSGSPVFIVNFGWIIDRIGNMTMGNRIIFLGVIAANYSRTHQVEIRERPAGHVASFDEAIGLGIVYKATCVDECAHLFLSSNGLNHEPIEEESAVS